LKIGAVGVESNNVFFGVVATARKLYNRILSLSEGFYKVFNGKEIYL